ncbi:MAG: FAD-dependent oxidoreductase [Gemmataceae bacterium]|nr:FAD-dependent oxidoreductase [Gemmataceae bacterium]
MARRILIVGGVAGGMSAATRLRRLDEFAEIAIFERGPYVSFANCGLPYQLGGEIADKGKLIVQTPERLAAVFRLGVHARHEVIAVRPVAQEIDVRDLATGQIRAEKYDDLILSTGASPVVPNIPGIDRAGHFPLRTIPDLERTDDWIRTKNAKTALILGGGFIGLETAEQLHRRGLAVSVVEYGSQVLKPFDPEMAAIIHREIRKHGVSLRLGQSVVRFEAGDAAASIAVLADGTRLPADLVIVGVGVKPEAKLAADAGLKIGPTGGIAVDEALRTSDPHVWAIGDAIEVTHGVTGQPMLIPLGGPANRQGRTVADNICGRASRYESTIGTAIVRVFDQVAAVTGANETLLKKAGIPFEVVHLHPNSHAGYYPGAKPIALKVLFATGDGKILGAQAVGEDGVDKRIDVIATAIKAGMTVHDLADLELCYAPPFGSAKDPVNLAGMAAQNVLAGDVAVAQWHEVPGLIAAGAVVLDVRDAKERDGGVIPGSLGIPLAQLRDRLGELPKENLILAHCASGQRSYNACRVLMQHGFRCRNLAGSFKTWKAANEA